MGRIRSPSGGFAGSCRRDRLCPSVQCRPRFPGFAPPGEGRPGTGPNTFPAVPGQPGGCLGDKRLVSVSWWLVLHPNNFVGRGFLPAHAGPPAAAGIGLKKQTCLRRGGAPVAAEALPCVFAPGFLFGP